MEIIEHLQKQKKIKDITRAAKKGPVVVNMTEPALTGFVVQAMIGNIKKAAFILNDTKHLNLCTDNLSYIEENKINVFGESILATNTIEEFTTLESEQYEQGIKNLYKGKRGVYFATTKSIKDNIPEFNTDKPIVIKEGDITKQKDIFNKLEKWGYKNTDWCISKKMYAARGGIVDIFPALEQHPTRIEFDGNTVVSMRKFDVGTQESINQATKISIEQPLIMKGVSSDKKLYDLLFDKVDILLYITHINTPKKLSKLPLFEVFSEQIGWVDNKNTLSSETIKNVSKKVGGVFAFGKKYQKHTNITNIDGSFDKNILSTDLDILLIGNGKRPQKSKSVKIGGVEQKKINTLDDIQWGDILVHQDYGLGVYKGLGLVGTKETREENIKIEYLGGSSVFVPLNKFDRVHKYIGIGGSTPKLTKLGSGAWEKQKLTTKKSVEKVVSYLVENYKNKQRPRGFVYSGDKELINKVVDGFPYEETQDQTKAIKDVFNDLRNNKPMDRLVYGDVGFGKTEVAIRAAILAISSGRVVFFLAPTTVLSDQHYINCVNRLSPAGVNVELLSRFKNPTQQKEILKKYESGEIDLLVGTHRLLSSDVKTDRLGLLIVDEEHRFGVKHKEAIRRIKARVDVLTLTATPIPRTLQQSLVGIRDTSKIETPPQERQPIKTYICRFNWKDIKTKIKHELSRGGQVYFVHNKIENMPFVVDKISSLFPNMVVKGAHGQMPSGPLEKTVLGFFNKKVDVLVCTTIIESGLDVRNANTIIINDAQNFGLSQLYQIRGRVGRGNRQAYCYLYIPKKTKLLPDAYKRLKTLEYYTSLGSGYGVAIKDLEIRGAGNMFGHEQSGQMLRVGLNLYNKILSEALSEKSGDLVPPQKKDIVVNADFGAFIDTEYMPTAQDRLNYYQQLANAKTEAEVDDIKRKLKDQFGSTNEEAENLFLICKVRCALSGSVAKKCYIKQSNVHITVEQNCGVSINKLINGVGGIAKTKNITHRFEQSKRGFVVVFQCKTNSDLVSVVRDFAKLFSVVGVG